MYLHNELAPGRIHKLLPNVKMLVIFRQPVDRLFSRYLHLASENRAPTRSFEDALDRSTIWWVRDDLVKEGFYYQHLSRYLALFPRQNFKILFYEDLKARPMEIMKDIFDFLGVDNTFVPDTTVTYNELGLVRNKFYDKLIGKDGLVKKLTSLTTSQGVYQRIRDSNRMRKILNAIRKVNLEKPTLDPELRTRMTQDIYREDILKLSQVTGRDLSHWLK